MTVKEAEETVEYILNTTKKIRYYESRLNESVDILKNKIWPGLRGEIVTIFSEQKQVNKCLSEYNIIYAYF